MNNTTKHKLLDYASYVGESAYSAKIVVDGNYTYTAIAAPGSLEAEPVWRALRMDNSTAGTTLVKYADGNCNFDNVATDLSALTYA